MPTLLGRCLIFCILAGSAAAQDGTYVEKDRRIPDEFETAGGHALGFGNAGTAAAGGVSAVRLNPAMLPMEKNYAVAGGYNWPTFGREFYQAGIVDTTTASFGAGFLYNGFMDEYEPNFLSNEVDNPDKKDSTVKQRLSVGVGKALQTISVGANVQYLEATYMDKPINSDIEQGDRARGTSFGIGVAGLLTPNIRFGISGENLANRKIAPFAPKTFHAGIAYLINKHVSVNFDLRQRDRVEAHERLNLASGDFALASDEQKADSEKDNDYRDPERMAFASGSARVYDMLRILGAYGQTIDGPSRRSFSGGLAIVNGDMSVSYTFSRPYLAFKESQQAMNVSMSINM